MINVMKIFHKILKVCLKVFLPKKRQIIFYREVMFVGKLNLFVKKQNSKITIEINKRMCICNEQ